ncbi:hypothetical protein KSP39_PZI017404 [Platanthera zijinensis]|uniref:Transposase n=1 Tax=Platanthera zijinensis TaxID=2320716 RepID=A0AAP0B4U6_9ASPA
MRSHQFKVCAEKEKIEYKGSVCLDVSTRWNSTYLMLQVALKFRKVFDRYEDEILEYATDLDNGPPTKEDWENAQLLVIFLEKFYTATKLFSGSAYVTSNSFFEQAFFLEHALITWSASTNIHHKAMALRMKEKFDKYWGNIHKMNILLVIAIVMDPRYKLEYLRHCYEIFFRSESVEQLLAKILEVMRTLYDYYKNIFAKYSTTTSTTENFISTGTLPNPTMEKPLDEMIRLSFLQKKKARLNNSNMNELDIYLKEELVCEGDDLSKKFDILSWWKVNSTKYKILSLLARDILAIPVSTVASESAFSTGGRVLDRFRSSLSPKIVEGLVCTQDWFRASPHPMQIEEDLHQIEELENGIINSYFYLIILCYAYLGFNFFLKLQQLFVPNKSF